MIAMKYLTFAYRKSHEIFSNISLTIKPGITGMLGANGVGKTTLLHLMAGLEFPLSGECSVLGYEPARRDPSMLKELFYLPDTFEVPAETISSFAGRHSHFYPRFDAEQLRRYLDEFEVNPCQKMTQLSFGQAKKAMLAYGLSLNAAVTLLDEPSNGFDIASKIQLRKILTAGFVEDRCMVISTHQIADFLNMFDQILILDHNQVLVNHSMDEIAQNLVFKVTDRLLPDTLYYEPILGGYQSVVYNRDRVYDETLVDIELLYKTAMSNKERIASLLNQESQWKQ